MTNEISALGLLELLLEKVKKIIGQIQRNDINIKALHNRHGVAALYIDAITIELDRRYLAHVPDSIPLKDATYFEFSLRVHTNYRHQDKSGREIRSNNTPKNLYLLEFIRKNLLMDRVLGDEGEFLIYKLDNLRPNLLFDNSYTIGGELKICVTMQSDSIGYQSKLHYEPASEKSIVFAYSDDFRYCKRINENGEFEKFHFTPMQAEAVKFLLLCHKGKRPDVPQSKVLEEIGSRSERLRDLFRSCKNCWGNLIIKGQRRDCIRLNI